MPKTRAPYPPEFRQQMIADSTQTTGLRWGDTGAPVPVTGQTTSYATGDDGDLERGVAWPIPRFTDNGDGTVTDNLTGLIWLKDATCAALAGTDADGKADWTVALSAAAALATGTCGLTDSSTAGAWRLPNRFEQESLLHLEFVTPSLPNGAGTGKFSTDGDAFSGVVVSAGYWTSTSGAVSADSAWFVDLDSGAASSTDRSVSNYVWPVRGGQ